MPLRVVFFGTPNFAVPTLRALLASTHTVAGVVTQPDRPRGRGHRLQDSPVKALARDAGVPVWQPERLKDPQWLAAFAALEADVGIVAAYGRILPQVVLDVPRHGLLNVHASLLPKYRGAAPIQRAVMAGEPETGITIMRVVLALDAGPVLARAVRSIGPDETAADVERDLATLGADLLLQTLVALESGTAQEVPQVEADATYAPRMSSEEGLVDWAIPAATLHDRVRGLHPWPHAYTFLGPRRVTLLRGQPQAVRTSPAPAEEPPLPGTILDASGDRLLVAAGQGAFRVTELQPEGKRAMSTREFLASRPGLAGQRFLPHPGLS